jgi:hypothetical protein
MTDRVVNRTAKREGERKRRKAVEYKRSLRAPRKIPPQEKRQTQRERERERGGEREQPSQKI